MDWGAGNYRRGVGGEEEEERRGGSESRFRGGEPSGDLSSADEVCTMEDDQPRRDDTRSQGRESDPQPSPPVGNLLF